MLFFLSSFATIVSMPIEAIHAPAIAPPYIEVSSQESLLDQEIIIKLSQLQPKEMIKVQAQTIDDNGIEWTSFGLFQSDDLGEIDLSRQSPI